MKNLLPIYKAAKEQKGVKGTPLEKTIDAMIERGAKHEPNAGILDVHALYAADNLQVKNVIFFPGGFKSKDIDPHNLFATDDDGSQAKQLPFAPKPARGRDLSPGMFFSRASSSALKQTVAFFEWAYKNMDKDVRCLVFAEAEW